MREKSRAKSVKEPNVEPREVINLPRFSSATMLGRHFMGHEAFEISHTNFFIVNPIFYGI